MQGDRHRCALRTWERGYPASLRGGRRGRIRRGPTHRLEGPWHRVPVFDSDPGKGCSLPTARWPRGYTCGRCPRCPPSSSIPGPPVSSTSSTVSGSCLAASCIRTSTGIAVCPLGRQSGWTKLHSRCKASPSDSSAACAGMRRRRHRPHALAALQPPHRQRPALAGAPPRGHQPLASTFSWRTLSHD